MKYTKYIVLLSVLFFAACTTELIEPSCDLNGNDMVQLVSRVVPFSDRDVTTRANKNEDENKITSIDYFIFNANDVCIFHQPVSSIEPLLVDKSSSVFEDVDLKECYIISIANGPELNVTEGTTTWDTISSQSIDVSGVSITNGKLKEKGLPMIGRYPEAGTFDFGSTKQGSVLTIPMKSLFSKIVFNISVDSDEIRPGENQPLPTFTLRECNVSNLVSSVDFIGGRESTEGQADGTNDATAVNGGEFSVGAAGETVDGGTPLSFSFYLPERFLTAGTSSTEFTYPFNRDEEYGYRQRYKPLLAKGYDAYNSSYNKEKDKKATFVRLKGEYTNHQGHSYDVSYDIYVGNDNYGNFDIVRNTQYNNNVIIRGINNSNSQSPDLGSVSIDHRVNVERSAPIIINLRRETLLDSHFEVRPLLIRKNGKYDPEIDLSKAKVKVEVLYNEGELPNGTTIKNWIGLERSFGNGIVKASSDIYLVNDDLSDARKNAAGKRKYFTTDLTTTTLNSSGTFDQDGYSTAGGTTVIVPITDIDQRVWIYIDECTIPGDGVRSAKIRVSYDLDGDGQDYSNPIVYVINQRLLYPVTYNGITYHIEYHEEYLYNYDSDDQYGQTHYEGMDWGLNGEQLSRTHRAYFATGNFADIMNWLLDYDEVKPYYDFYLTRDISNASATRRDNAGSTFCDEIIKTINGAGGLDTDDSNDIKVLNLSQDPKSAIEYCYNRNKRNINGEVVDPQWYLPAIDEIENIMMGGYSTFEVFQNKYYWSSQPAFLRGRGHYYSYSFTESEADYYYDDVMYARSTKVVYEGNDKYGNVSSGVDGYEQLMDIYKPLWGMENPPELIDVTREPFDYSVVKDGKRFSITIEEMTDKEAHLGNDPRTQRNRIRCVHKSN